MQHRTVHGDACICHSCAATTSTGDAVTQPDGELCAHVHLGGRGAVAARGDSRIGISGRQQSAPVVAREARLQ